MRIGKALKLGMAAFAAILVLGLLLWARDSQRGDMADQSRKTALLGVWQFASAEGCADRYPARVEFRQPGIYEAPDGPETGAIWHGGEWAITEAGEIAVMANNDAMLRYRIARLTESDLVLEGAGDCRITYIRS